MTQMVGPTYKNVQYGKHELNKMDLWIASSSKPTPVVIWFHGGGFWYGDKREDLPDLSQLLASGISVASVNYRLCPQVYLPTPLYDAFDAIQFLYSNATSWGILPNNIALAGVSAGGMIALWIAFRECLSLPSRIRAVVAVDAQTTFDPSDLQGLLGRIPSDLICNQYGLNVSKAESQEARRVYAEASPTTYLNKHAPPVCTIYRLGMVPITLDTQWATLIHHPIFGQYLQRKMDRFGISCTWLHSQTEETLWRSATDFLATKTYSDR